MRNFSTKRAEALTSRVARCFDRPSPVYTRGFKWQTMARGTRSLEATSIFTGLHPFQEKPNELFLT